MPLLPYSLNADPIHSTYGNPFRPAGPDNQPFPYYTLGAGTGTIQVILHNVSKGWADGVFEMTVDAGVQPVKTGHFDPGQSRTISVPIANYRGQPCKLTRWAPGVLGIAGNGGGDMEFVCPPDAQDVFIEFNIEDAW